jgi:hypothetical protein
MSGQFYDPKQQALLEAARKASENPKSLLPHEASLLKESGMDPEILTRPLTEAEMSVVERKREALRKIFEPGAIKAKFKIELNFGKDRSDRGHFPGSLIVLRSGSALGGGGDESMFFCPDNNCPGFIPQNLVSSMLRIAVCPKCERQWHQGLLSDMMLFRLTHQFWATVVARCFIRLGSDADVYLKTHPIDLRIQTMKEQLKDMGGVQMGAARSKRIRLMYSLPRILKDLSNGADLETRFRQLLRA